MAQDRIIECIYCGRTAKRDRDHVPARTLIPESKRLDAQLVTVPSCAPCNRQQSLDEEYFKTVLSLDSRIAETDLGRELFQDIRRQARRKRGPVMKILREARETDLMTPAGLYVGKGFRVELSEPRLAAVAARTVEGLFYHHFGWALGADYEINAWSGQRVSLDIIGPHSGIAKLMSESAERGPIYNAGDGCLRYRFNLASDDPKRGSGVWVLLFYDTVSFCVISLPKERARRDGSTEDQGIETS